MSMDFTERVELMQTCAAEEWTPSKLALELRRLENMNDMNDMIYEAGEMAQYEVFEPIVIYRNDARICEISFTSLNEEKTRVV